MNRKDADRIAQDFLDGKLARREFMTRLLAAGASLTAVAAFLEACGGGSTEETPLAPGELGEPEKELVIYNWSDYIGEEVVPEFQKETGIKVDYLTYESNEEMMAKLQIGGGGYDIVVPTGYIVTILAAQDLLFPLAKKYLTNWSSVAPLFNDPPFDPGNQYSVPYQWGTTGIAYRSDLITTPPDSWAVFHDPTFSGKMTMMDDQRDVLGAWLKYRGKSLNSTDPADLEQAKADAITAKTLLRSFISAPVKGQLVTGDIWLSQLWNGDTFQARVEQPALAYALPKEGAAIWTDSLVIPKTAPHKRAAHEFMNFILRPDVGAKISDFTGYGTPNAKSAELVANKIPYPTEDEMKRLEYQKDLGEATKAWDRIWTEIKSA